ncbi:MAG: histidine phosphatase family protein [Planktomarina sp.]
MTHMYPDLLVLRHGQTLWNSEHRMQGHLNSPLTALGVRQAQDQNAILADLNLDGFSYYSSPQGRAFQTAGLALAGIATTITTSDLLMEVDMGIWSGKTLDEVLQEKGVAPQDYTDLDLYDWIPDGEGMSGLFERCRRFLGRLNGPSVIVTHGMTSRCLRAIALGKTLENITELPGGQGIVHCVKGGQHTTLKKT